MRSRHGSAHAMRREVMGSKSWARKSVGQSRFAGKKRPASSWRADPCLVSLRRYASSCDFRAATSRSSFALVSRVLSAYLRQCSR